MRRLRAVCWVAAAAVSAACVHNDARSSSPAVTTRVAPARPMQLSALEAAAASLTFAELFDPRSSQLRPSQRALALDGKRVRMVGFMAKLELELEASFYLTPRPVTGDEAGGGTADLPPGAVRVVLPFLKGTAMPHIDGGIEVVGRFEVGNVVDERGLASAFRIRVEPANTPQAPGPRPADERLLSKKEARHEH
jgi:hypothetical protein